MHDYIETLLLNMLFLVIFLLFIPHLTEIHLKNLPSSRKVIIKFTSVLAGMVACMSFPFALGDEIIMDLRTVAIMVGGLYLGRKASVLLIAIFIIIRINLGGVGSGAYASVIASGVILIVLLSLADIFDKATKQNRIIIACSFSLFISTLVFLIRAILFDHLIGSDFMVVTAFFLIHFLSTFFIVYFYEMLNEALTINKQIIKAEKLEVVCHLASSISHEVRNPLTVVKGFLQMLNEKEFEEDKRKKFIDLSLQEIDRANDIIGSYLTFAKPVQQEPAIIDLKQELDRSITVITPLANMNSVEIQTRIEHCYIKGDPLLLQQCFLNIIKNSIEAMPNGGTLCINTENINGQVLIEITDDGEGMMDEQLRRLGEPFFTTKGREGTGLGMMAVIKIIDMMNGKLDVSSNKKEGTQFRIYLPCSKEHHILQPEELLLK